MTVVKKEMNLWMLGKHSNIHETIRKDKQSTKSLKWKKENGAKNYKGTNQTHSIITIFLTLPVPYPIF